MKPIISIIVAMTDDGIIGIENRLPWHIPEDLQHFKKVTLGQTIIMGRKTFESIGKVLPGRKNIVITRQRDWCYDGVVVCHDIHEALSSNFDGQDVFIIGGSDIFRIGLEIADQIYLTRVDLVGTKYENIYGMDNVIRFPDYKLDNWTIANTLNSFISKDGIKCQICLLKRKL